MAFPFQGQKTALTSVIAVKRVSLWAECPPLTAGGQAQATEGERRKGLRMNAFEIPTLETERLRLRPFRDSDLDDYAALHADPEVLRYLGCGPEPWDRGRS